MANNTVFSLFFFVTLFTCLVAAIVNNDHILLPSQLHQDNSLSSSSSCTAPDPKLNPRPVIGILSNPGDGAAGRLSNSSGISYIAASYVKFVESGGARVIPLLYNESPDSLLAKLSLTNGVIFTGGLASSGPYLKALQFVFQAALERNDAGEHFPVLGLNLGGNLLIKIVAEQADVLETFNASSLPSSLQLWINALEDGSLYQTFPLDLLQLVRSECLVLHNHRYAITPRRLQYNRKLSSFFDILATSTDRDNKVFVSTARGTKYPVTVNLWNPEKNAFEWATSLKAPHTANAVLVTQSAANFFVSEARKSSNRPDAQAVRDNLIYNYKATYSGVAGKGFDQVYIFE
ncbi:gamma-glutamyl hydrolase-like [Vigna unguiculata]|uniref:gamma-glutamyl hydrolase-like n=1 Tax=Vigna unguiculata TaxID=3917 RepID=UPI001016C974|nr:gamma-glutamyl hydrolase-like [Vigna unguiculata]